MKPQHQPADVLILSAPTGGGHLSLAGAIQEYLEPHAAATIAEPVPRTSADSYRIMSRYARWLWGAGYRLMDTPARALALHRLWDRLCGPALDQLLRARPYQLVVTTYPLLSYAAVAAVKRQSRAVPCVALFADPERVHHTWLTERRIALTLAPTRETHAQALAAGFSPDRLRLTGWPVRRQFSSAALPPRAATLSALGFTPDLFTVLVQGGGEGSAGFAACVDALLAAGTPQILLAVGTHHRLAERFRGHPQVRAIGFTAEPARLMAAADVVFGKAGPNTLFEAVTLGRPFVATTFIPGQEAGNLDFIRRHGLGWVAVTPGEQRQLLGRLLADPAHLAARHAAVARYRAWNNSASQRIPALLAAQLHAQHPAQNAT